MRGLLVTWIGVAAAYWVDQTCNKAPMASRCRGDPTDHRQLSIRLLCPREDRVVSGNGRHKQWGLCLPI
jgi:hypothetical protein